MGKYQDYIRFGYGKSDLTLLYANPEIMKSAALELAEPFKDKAITKVLALDAQGFPLGALIAQNLNAGLVLVRKGGKIAWETKKIDIVDYSKTPKVLEIATGVLSEKDRVLIVDDWSETGAQLRGTIELAEQCGAKVIGAAAVNMGEKVLQNKSFSNYILHTLEHID